MRNDQPGHGQEKAKILCLASHKKRKISEEAKKAREEIKSAKKAIAKADRKIEQMRKARRSLVRDKLTLSRILKKARPRGAKD